MRKSGKTKSGFEFDIETETMDNMDLIDAIAETDDGNPFAISRVIRLLLGDQKKALYDHVRTEDGRVPIETMNAEVMEIFDLLGEKEKK